MSYIDSVCPRCGAPIRTSDPQKPIYCGCCGEYTVIGTKNAVISDARSESDDLFLSGCSYLALGDTENAADRFLAASSVSPSVARYWLYLLYALTERFNKLWLVAERDSSVSVKGKRVLCRNVYRNFLRTARPEDHALAAKELGVNTEPARAEIWLIILYRILVPETSGASRPPKDAPYVASYAYNELKRTIPAKAETLRESLCARINPVSDGILEINSLAFYKKERDGVLRLDTRGASVIEFSSDDIPGKEDWRAFCLTDGIESIGTSFPFTELTVANGVEKIPDRLLFCCENLERVTLPSSVSVIGREAFANCIRLSSINLSFGISEIGDMAFFNTAMRVLEIPPSVKKLGSDVLGIMRKRTPSADISQYLMIIDEQTTGRDQNWNRVGAHRCGYAVRKKVGADLFYPIKSEVSENGNAVSVPLDTREKMVFEALAYSTIDPSEFKKGSGSGSLGSKLSSLFRNKK